MGLASRGAWYEIRKAALERKSDGHAYHDHCRCEAIESYSNEDLPDIILDLGDEWHEVTKNVAAGEMKSTWDKHVRDSRPNGLAQREIAADGTVLAWPKPGEITMRTNLRAHLELTTDRPLAGNHFIDGLHAAQEGVASGRPLNEAKGFFTAAAEDEKATVMDWLGDVNSGAIRDVIADPAVVTYGPREGYNFTADVDSPWGRTRLTVAAGRARKKDPSAWKVNTVWGSAGDGVVILKSDGSVITRDLEGKESPWRGR